MAATGIKYFYDYIGLDNPVLAAFSFNDNEGLSFGSDYEFQGARSGVFDGVINSGTFLSRFYDHPGSGHFDSRMSGNLSIAGALNVPDWTLFMLYERTGQNAHTLISTLQNANGTPSGFAVGINEANKLYMEYYNNVDGLQTVTFSGIIPSKNIISVAKNNSIIRLSYFDPNAEVLLSQTFDVFQNNFVDSSLWTIGSGRGTGTFRRPVFEGYVDEVILISGVLIEDFQRVLCSGFYASRNADTSSVVTICSESTILSGVITGAASGIAGFQPFVQSEFIDICGEIHRIYGYSGLSGIISGTAFIPIIVSGCQQVTGVVDNGFTIHSGLLSSLGMEGLAVLWNIDAEDSIFSSVIDEQLHNTGRNRVAQFDLANGKFFLDSTYTSDEFLMYFNGQLTLFSGYTAYQSGYNLLFHLTGDYITSGLRIESNSRFEIVDTIIYDVGSGLSQAAFYTNIASGSSFAGMSFGDSLVFLNGQLLTSGVQYSGNQMLVSLSGLSLLSIVERDFARYFEAQPTGYINTDKFLRNSSQIWMNGIRLQLGYDYVEIGDTDMLSGRYRRQDVDESIYNNTDDFFNL